MQRAEDSAKFFLLLIAMAFGHASASELMNKELPTKRLVNATKINIKYAPFVMQLRNKTGYFQCGASLITPRFVLTAAHCISLPSPDSLIVVGNANSIHEEGIQRRVELIIKHPKYKSKYDYDIAVLKLDRDMIGAHVKTIPLYEKSVEQGNTLQVYGWGRTYFNSPKLSDHLRTIRLPVIPQSECAAKYRELNMTITENMVCTFEPGKDACNSDSGGPAVYKDTLAGIVSWGIDCGVNPGVFTRIDKTRDFINECLKK